MCKSFKTRSLRRSFSFLANGARLPQEGFIKKVEEYIFYLHKIKQKYSSGVENNGSQKK